MQSRVPFRLGRCFLGWSPQETRVLTKNLRVRKKCCFEFSQTLTEPCCGSTRVNWSLLHTIDTCWTFETSIRCASYETWQAVTTTTSPWLTASSFGTDRQAKWCRAMVLRTAGTSHRRQQPQRQQQPEWITVRHIISIEVLLQQVLIGCLS